MKKIPPDAIKRISMYLHNLKRLQTRGIKLISSSALADMVNVTSDQLRKDLSYFGGFGKRGVGYDVVFLIEKLEEIIGLNSAWEIVLVGAGRLGSALMSYPGFSQDLIKIAAAFDKDKSKVGTVINGVKVEDMQNFKQIVTEKNIKIGMLCVHVDVAQEIANLMIESGIKAIMNFAPINITVPPNVYVSRVDMASKLESLIFFVSNN